MAAAAGNHPTLRAPQHRVSPKAMRYWATRALAGWLVVAAIQVVWLLADGGGPVHTTLLLATAALSGVHIAVMPQWRYRVHRWEAAPTAVYTQTGWLDQERRIAPVSRIQTVDTERGPVAQALGLASVTVTTASAAGPLKIHGLDLDVARHLVEDLTALTIAERGDAT